MRVFAVWLFPLMSMAANYSAQKAVVDGVEVVRLGDAARHTEVAIAPSLGNLAYEFKVNGKSILWLPDDALAQMQARPQFGGIPFLAPWANRLSEDAFFANGVKFRLNPGLGNIHRDENQNPIHGLLTFSRDWKVIAIAADSDSAVVTSRLEFWKHPELMAQFPFAHSIETTYRLHEGVLEVRTAIENLSADPMPVGIGYHPYFQLHDTPRDQWKVHLAARDRLALSRMLIPTGERRPVEFADPLPLSGVTLDDVFGGLVRDDSGRATFWVEGAHERISVIYGTKYTVAVVYAPASRHFICFEPMSAITDGFNLAHAGVYKELQSIAPGDTWRESFWIAPTGF
ncbi:MAG TPA: aldose 1-epimerase [Bryobacteraceae bacterium]|jgi:aldose 1-epimerase|nr:aldose 1-epimerase [Bryobacteraceae bacterium]